MIWYAVISIDVCGRPQIAIFPLSERRALHYARHLSGGLRTYTIASFVVEGAA